MGSVHSASLEPHSSKKMVRDVRVWEAAQGDEIKRAYESEFSYKKGYSSTLTIRASFKTIIEKQCVTRGYTNSINALEETQ